MIFQAASDKQEQKRDKYQNRGQSQRNAQAPFEPKIDRERHGLRYTFEIACKQNCRSKFTDGARPRQDGAAQDRAPRKGKHEKTEQLPC